MAGTDEESVIREAQTAALRLAEDLERDAAELLAAAGVAGRDAGVSAARAAAAAARRVAAEMKSPAAEENS